MLSWIFFDVVFFLEEDCSFWAATGDECESNRDHMMKNCAPACQVCHLLDIRLRCPIKPGNEAVFKPGDLNKLFENIDLSTEYLTHVGDNLPLAEKFRDNIPNAISVKQ